MEQNKVILDQLVSLFKLDVDAMHAYTSAIERIDLPDVKRQLTSFRGDHERHLSDLSPLIQRLGGPIPERSPDLKGFFIQGFTAIRSAMGNESALKAMKGNEELTNKHYAQALEHELPADVRTVVQRNREDERRHLEYIEGCLNQRIWERPEKTVA